MSLDEIETLRKMLESCPDCRSTEGFWVIAKRDKTLFQCKTCGAIVEVCKTFPSSKQAKESKGFLRKLKT